MRCITGEQIHAEVQDRVLSAAIHTPSTWNTQTWRFLLVDDLALKGSRFGGCAMFGYPTARRRFAERAPRREVTHRNRWGKRFSFNVSDALYP
jgi:hypothetical protein